MGKRKLVYFFGGQRADGGERLRHILGGKGAGLAEMTNRGMPVPPGFTISAEVCIEVLRARGSSPAGLKEEVRTALTRMERLMGRTFGDANDPLLLSVRSGAAASMPGMMDTVLNLGLSDRSVEGLRRTTGNGRFAYDSHRRFLQMYGDVVLGVGREPFEERLNALKAEKGVRLDIDLDEDDLHGLAEEFEEIILKRTGRPFPQRPWDQLWGAIVAVFRSWETPRAVEYRRLHGIPDDLGTAVNVQAMVFGNKGPRSATGVAFTRDPATGEARLYGEFLPNAQGQDVVSGVRTPQPLMAAGKKRPREVSLEEAMPDVFRQLVRCCRALERHYRDMLDIEFTIEEGTLWLLQTRRGKRTAAAAVRTAVEMAHERLIDRNVAILRVPPRSLDQLLHPSIDPRASVQIIARGLPASPGAACGRVVFTADEAKERGGTEPVILVRPETSPDDIHGMAVAQAILTARGGRTSHAAVVARGMGKCCVVGCESLQVDNQREEFTVGSLTVRKGEFITVDGTTGRVLLGEVPLVRPELSGEFRTLMSWADKVRRLRVRTNADTPHDARVARDFGAEGIGLCRTEHMFFEGDRIDAMREMILAESPEGRRKALAKILPMQRADFQGIFEAMEGLPVTIRLLDPPLHEFLPTTEEEIDRLAAKMGVEARRLRGVAEGLREANPMLGHRGCRLGITYPEITAMQARAIFEAACEVMAARGKVSPEVMVPLVATAEELRRQKEIVQGVAAEVQRERRLRIRYTIGTMIELPRAALRAEEIAREAEFFSFGTNDLTQTVFGLSRDDAGRFLPHYVEAGILPEDPFQTLDRAGVGELIQIAVQRGRKARPDLKVGICGEHGGDPASIAFCHSAGLDYVSCSPFRVPVARLAAAHAALGGSPGED